MTKLITPALVALLLPLSFSAHASHYDAAQAANASREAKLDSMDQSKKGVAVAELVNDTRDLMQDNRHGEDLTADKAETSGDKARLKGMMGK